MAGIVLDWSAIRPLNRSRADGFEELCSQLARAEYPRGSRFERKGTPDAGVECYAVLSDGTEWGWQAKYFDTLGDSQWPQLDDSVKTALEKHPQLVRYYVCIPLDLPDARLGGRKSAKDRWDEHIQKWSGWAVARSMSVEFVYWGSHELLERLQRPENAGRVRFWFDVQAFNQPWFSARLEEALKAAGPRYTPAIHVGLPIASEFESLGRTQAFFEDVKACARPLRQAHRGFQSAEPKETDTDVSAVTVKLETVIQAILRELGGVSVQPIGELPFSRITGLIGEALTVASDTEKLLAERERTYKPAPPKEGVVSRERDDLNPYRERRQRLWSLSADLREVHETLQHTDRLASGSLLLLTGAAGTGKTHILCDIAKQRITAGLPTVLLMGQRFLNTTAPWVQALDQLDLSLLRAEEFIGALEAAAQAADHRALLIIDALNEGEGRRIWPDNLAALLAQVERSPWIAVVLSIRSSYVDTVVPLEVQDRAVCVVHEGFAEHEYDATRTFFVHYGLELPSTPLLAPEFRNPLFLKTLCEGLKQRGDSRLPRGFHGITATFDLYLTAINQRLASALGTNPKDKLVQRSLEKVCDALFAAGKRWLPRGEVEQTVNALLPGREFERSLSRGLVAEGLLIEEIARGVHSSEDEVVFISYERFADHLLAKTWLDRFLDKDSPATAFAEGQPLGFVGDKNSYVEPGLIEAMCIQVPERTGRELVSLVPGALERWGIRDAFRESLVWRASTAFSEETRSVLNKLCDTQHALHATIEALLTLASIPGHPLNARFLDQRLRKDTMADRDAWWSIYLHGAWESHGAVDRLVDWASAIVPSRAMEDETIDLCAIALAWMLTTSNRFLRDRATKALVCLLTGRIDAVSRFVEHFADVDDSYVAERVYAIAYATVMRCHNPAEVCALAKFIYARVFEQSKPPAHILLRDYARGVIERAIYLHADVSVDVSRIRPPYRSAWPTIPSEDELASLISEDAIGNRYTNEYEWGRDRIIDSVMNDDFAFYVIGTNSSQTSSRWLALRLDEPTWRLPQRRQDKLCALISEFSEQEKLAWRAFEEILYSVSFIPRIEGEELSQKKETSAAELEATLTEEHLERLSEILDEKDNDEASTAPGFDLGQIQRYIVRRVFEMGWTSERFGEFDRISVGHRDRDASKAERIGKKYQWIAYHEIMALIADHFQYRENHHSDGGDRVYEGPWRDYLRNIDPSCTLRSAQGGTSWDSHAPAWWAPTRYENWGDTDNLGAWTLRFDDLPPIAELLAVREPDDDSRWLNVQGHFIWKQHAPADREPTDVDRREVWYICTGYLIREDDADAFMRWAEGVDFWNQWMPTAPHVYPMFVGEHGWAPASRYFYQQYFGDSGWLQPEQACPTTVHTLACEHLSESSGFDCSISKTFWLRLPTPKLISGLGLRWDGDANFVSSDGRLAAQDPTARMDGPSALLLREDLLREYVAREKLTVVWTVVGEKRELGRLLGGGQGQPRLRLSGAIHLASEGLRGFIKHIPDGTAGKAPNVPNVTISRIP